MIEHIFETAWARDFKFST